MRFAKLKTNETLEELASRVTKAPSKAAGERNLAALKRANPHATAGPRKGEEVGVRFVAIPHGLEGEATKESREDASALATSAVERARSRLTEVAKGLPGELEKERGRNKEALKRMSSSAFKREAGKHPELKASLDRVRAAAKEREEALESLLAIQARVMETVAGDLSDLVRSVAEIPGTPPDAPSGRSTGQTRKADGKGVAKKTGGKAGEAGKTPSRKPKPAEDEKSGTPTREDLPPVRDLPAFLARIDDPAVVRKLQKADKRKTAKPIFKERIQELEKKKAGEAMAKKRRKSS